jgi:heme/copper-type cytochrome/quinol oxidase subunit 1
MLLFDRMFGTHFFIPEGGEPLLCGNTCSGLWSSRVYILVLPAMGITWILPVFVRAILVIGRWSFR